MTASTSAGHAHHVVHHHAGLNFEDPSGQITLRATGFDLRIVRDLAKSKTSVLAALDAATSLDPRERGVGGRVLAATLAEYRR